MRKWIRELVTLVLAGVLTAVIVALLTGQPLAGLTKIQQISQIFLKTTVPGWLLACVVFVAIWLGYHGIASATFSRRKTTRVHFVPDLPNCGWALSADKQVLDIRATGKFTANGPETLTILKMYIRKTEPASLIANIPRLDGSGRVHTVTELWLEPRTPTQAQVFLRLKPPQGTIGRPLSAQLILRDNYNRDFPVEKLDFPYIGQQRPT
jgi:hypothetical protein